MSKYRIHYTAHPYSTHGILVSAVGTNHCVLDVGCNEGYIGTACDPSNVFYGIDVDPDSLAVAKQHYRDAACMDLNQPVQLPWPVRFDVILFGDVLEHLLDPRTRYLELVENYLSPGGKVIISLPNIANWAVRLNLLLGKFDYQETGILDRTHLHFYTFQSAKETFAANQMKILQITGGSNIFGSLIHALPFTKGLLAHTIILEMVRDQKAE